MRLILFCNKGKFDSIAKATVEIFPDVRKQNQPWLSVRLKCLLAALKPLTLDSLSFAGFALPDKHFSQKQNLQSRDNTI
jgi:hypothetical protein